MQYVGQYCILPANTKFASVFVIVIHSEWRIEGGGGGGGGTGGLCSPHPFLDLFFLKIKNKWNKFYTTFRWLHVIGFKWKENKCGNLIYTVRGHGLFFFMNNIS